MGGREMSEAIERITAHNGAPPAQMIGPVLVHSGQLFGAVDDLIWGTVLHAVPLLSCAGGSAGPITFDGKDGKLELTTGVSADWKLYAEFDAGWHRSFEWQSDFGTDEQSSGVIERAENGHLWYFVTPPGGNPDGELVVKIVPKGSMDPDDTFMLYHLNFYLFR